MSMLTQVRVQPQKKFGKPESHDLPKVNLFLTNQNERLERTSNVVEQWKSHFNTNLRCPK